jgi:hypothetical protein
MKFVISWFPAKIVEFLYIKEGTHFTQGGDNLFVKTHEPYKPDNMKCQCGGTWNARNEHGAAVHFCNGEYIITMNKRSKAIGG